MALEEPAQRRGGNLAFLRIIVAVLVLTERLMCPVCQASCFIAGDVRL